MITGIYKLSFSPTLEYVDAAFDIEKQWEWFESMLLANKASAKIMAAYKKHGMPTKHVLFECHKDHLDFLLSYYTDKVRPSLNSGKIENPLTKEEFELVENNLSLLEKSTLELMKLFEDLEGWLDAADEKIGDIADIKERLIQKEAELNKILRLPWWKRIFL